MEEKQKSAKERVIEKFNMMKDLKKNKLRKSIRIKEVDNKIMAEIDIEGLPAKKNNGLIENSYRSFTKIFNDINEFTEYAKEFFSKSDEEIIKSYKE